MAAAQRLCDIALQLESYFTAAMALREAGGWEFYLQMKFNMEQVNYMELPENAKAQSVKRRLDIDALRSSRDDNYL